MKNSIGLASRSEITFSSNGGTEVVQQRARFAMGTNALAMGRGRERGSGAPARISPPILLSVRCNCERIWKASSQGEELTVVC